MSVSKEVDKSIFKSKKVEWLKLEGNKLLVIDVSAVMRSNMKYLDTPQNRIQGLYKEGNKKVLSWVVDGEKFNTSALYGILRLFKTFNIHDNVVFCFDSVKNLRKDIDKNYKRSRVKQGNEYYDQVNSFYKMLQLSGFTCLMEEGYEGDDLINKVVKDNYNKYDYIGVVSNDKDLTHLIDDKVFWLNALRTKGDIHRWNYEKELKVPYNTIILYKALVGDMSDEYKGVDGFGDKSFSKLVSGLKLPYERGIEENLIKNIGFNSLEESQALKSLKLAQPLMIDKKFNVSKDIDWFMFYEFCGKFGVKSIQKYVENEGLLDI